MSAPIAAGLLGLLLLVNLLLRLFVSHEAADLFATSMAALLIAASALFLVWAVLRPANATPNPASMACPAGDESADSRPRLDSIVALVGVAVLVGVAIPAFVGSPVVLGVCVPLAVLILAIGVHRESGGGRQQR
jgi:hypothetical protein